MEASTLKANSTSALWIAFAGWAFPGSGHFLQGRLWRGLIITSTVLVMYALGLILGGHLFSLLRSDTGLLSYVFAFCDFGSGIIYLGCNMLGIGTVDQAWRSTAEYGNVFLMVAGLLNYVAMLDAYDMAIGRKL